MTLRQSTAAVPTMAEREQLRAAVRDLLAARSDERAVRRVMATESGVDCELWHALGEMGLAGLLVSEECGGAGATMREVCIVAEEGGRSLMCAPYLSSAVMATAAVIRSADEQAAAEWLPRLSAGVVRAALAVREQGRDGRTAAVPTRAAGGAGDWLLTGVKNYVVDGASADLLIVAAEASGGPTLFAVDPCVNGITRTTLSTLDRTRRLARIELTGAPARLVGDEGGAADVLASVQDLSLIALAAESIGGAQCVLEMSVAYAKLREQFGRLIGSFQAIKHACADMLVQTELARSLVQDAVEAAAREDPDLPTLARMAEVAATDAFFACAAQNVQIHGGIGFTWEHPAHLYLRRAKSSQLLLGDAQHHRSQLAAAITPVNPGAEPSDERRHRISPAGR